ncbi:MAG: CDP-diacylglycerol--glycerol-3-phosphate 3-phosphatidyltransferase [Bacilli bacterium]|nr:CDP-diacylglycerol--glycerol-3-phosphate 3-phosphatidyltransferase [Bacilli bacterium]
MNLPNKLTLSRIILSLVIIFILLFPFDMFGIYFPTFSVGNEGLVCESEYFVAGVLFIIASLTDFFDGRIARKYGLITNLGKMLDAIADKVLVNSVLIILAAKTNLNPIIPVVIVLRDIVVNAIKMEAASKGKVVAAIKSGKLKTACLMTGIVLALFNNLPFELWNLQVADFLLYFATIMSIISMVQYYNLNKDLIFEKETKKK